MAYAGTTSTSPNPPRLTSQGIGSTAGGGIREWQYKSTHTAALVSSTGHFTDGQALGMQVGDIVWVQGSTTYVLTSHTVVAVSATGVSVSSGVSLSAA